MAEKPPLHLAARASKGGMPHRVMVHTANECSVLRRGAIKHTGTINKRRSQTQGNGLTKQEQSRRAFSTQTGMPARYCLSLGARMAWPNDKAQLGLVPYPVPVTTPLCFDSVGKLPLYQHSALTTR